MSNKKVKIIFSQLNENEYYQTDDDNFEKKLIEKYLNSGWNLINVISDNMYMKYYFVRDDEEE